MYSPISNVMFNEHIETGLDADSTSTVSASLNVAENSYVAWTVVANTGTHGTHVITLQCSLDDTNWASTASTLTGLGTVDNIQITAKYVRLKVTTRESAASTVDIIIQAK